MDGTLTETILSEHLIEGDLTPGAEVGIDIDQTLLQDATGSLVWLQFAALELDSVQSDLAVQYCDHLTYQFDYRYSDDHRFLRSATGVFDAHFARPGSGICHQVHEEQFAAPGTTLLGSDSHTPTAGGMGAFGVGSGGIDIAVAMAGEPYYFDVPEVVNIRLEGELNEWASAKDVILHLLGELTVTGGVNRVFEYTGPGVKLLAVPERATITNMGTELGATSSLFPSDERTREYLELLGREEAFTELHPDEDAEYADVIEIDLSTIEPLIATPSMPDNVVPVTEVAGTPVDQVVIGSCTNGSYGDILPVAKMLAGRKIAIDTEMIITPGSKRAAERLARNGWTAELMAAGVNVSESTCGACIGIGHVPASDSVSLRTFNRNFEGRSGLENDSVYLCSPETAAAAALAGEIIDPRDLGAVCDDLDAPGFELPERHNGGEVDLISPEEAVDDVLIKGPSIGDVPLKDPLGADLSGPVLLKAGDDVTTDHIVPLTQNSGVFRSNPAKLSQFTLSRIDDTFADRATAANGGIVVAGENYGQGSSREVAALCPMYLGVEAVFALSFARIHRANLFNFGLVPLTIDRETYDRIEQGDDILIVEDVADEVQNGRETFTVQVNDWETTAHLDASERERELLVHGGRLQYTKSRARGGC